jgi:hypothetical protein
MAAKWARSLAARGEPRRRAIPHMSPTSVQGVHVDDIGVETNVPRSALVDHIEDASVQVLKQR